MTVRNRPRIPTPDVTKEVLDREHRISNIGGLTTTAGGVINPATLMAHQLNAAYQGDLPLVEVFLSPIQEGDGSSSHNNTLHAGQPGTAALAKAVLTPSLTSPGIGPVITANLSPATVSQLTSLGLAVTTSTNNSPMLTRNVNGASISASPTTFTITDVKTGMPQTLTFKELSTIPSTIFADGQQSAPPPLALSLEISNSDDDGNKSSGNSSVGGVDDKNISRKTSVTSQTTAPAGSPKRSEVYV